MKGISVTLEGEEAVFSWKEGKVHCEGYDIESEKAVLALTRFGKGIGVLLVAINAYCKSEAEFGSEIKEFISGQEELILREYDEDEWPEGRLLFEYYSYSPDPNIRWGGLESACLSERHYKRMLKDSDTNLKARMASLYELPEKYFYKLANLSAWEINWRLAENSRCPIDVLEILAQDKEGEVRRFVAGNPACPESILEELAKDKVAGVRWRVALNPNCTECILETLAQDKDEDVIQAARAILANNKGLET